MLRSAAVHRSIVNATLRLRTLCLHQRIAVSIAGDIGSHDGTALYFMFYNFARVHQTIRVTPAMEAGISDHVWRIEEIVALLG